MLPGLPIGAMLALGLGALLVYFASRMLAEPLGGAGARGAGSEGASLLPRPMRAAVGHWVVIAALALGAILAGKGDLAVGIVFSSTIATLSVGVGLLVTLRHRDDPKTMGATGEAIDPLIGAPAWRMLVPAALVPLLGGFSGRLNLVHSAVLLVMGVLAVMLWRGGEAVATNARPKPAAIATRLGLGLGLVLAIVLGLALSAVGVTLVLRAVGVIMRVWEVPATGMAAALLGPIVVLPLVALASQPAKAARGGAGPATIDPLARCAGVALLNLCLLLPIVVLADSGRGAALAEGVGVGWLNKCAAWLNPPPEVVSLATTAPAMGPGAASSTGPTTAPTSGPTAGAGDSDDKSSAPKRRGVVMPLVTWRVDCPYLLLLALYLVPVSLGRWSLSRVEGQFLALSYFAYVVVSAQVAGW
jgi:Ca2+/Na+ antiporter